MVFQSGCTDFHSSQRCTGKCKCSGCSAASLMLVLSGVLGFFFPLHLSRSGGLWWHLVLSVFLFFFTLERERERA